MLSVSKPIRDFFQILSGLRRRAAQGDVSAMCDLGMWLQEDFQDKTGRSVVRRNPAYALPCRCRRFVNKDLRGHAKCSMHPRLGR
jgi:hypothetical protein